MAVFFLKNEQREHLKILREKSSDVVVDICKLALDYLTNGPNEKKYAVMAKKLNASVDLVQPTIEALVCMLIDATRANVSEAEFESLKSLGFSLDHISILWQFISTKKNFVENVLKATSTQDYRFRDLEWRLEGKIASRCLLNQSLPIITLKFHLDTEPVGENRDIIHPDRRDFSIETQKKILAQTDPNNLVHIIDVLEQALMESKTHRARNTIKAFH